MQSSWGPTLYHDMDQGNCRGMSSGSQQHRNKQDSNALCAGVDACKSICSQLPDCAGFTFHGDDSCTLHSACEPGSHGSASAAYVKQPVVTVTSSHDEHADRVRLHEGWHEHPAWLVTDGWVAAAGASDALNTEWWSQCWDCAPE